MITLPSLFTTVLRMSITSSLVAVGVIVARFALRKLPKAFSYALWAVLLFRLLCPLALSSPVSALGLVGLPSGISAARGLPHEPTYAATLPSWAVDNGDNSVSGSVPTATPAASTDTAQIVLASLSLAWLAGMLALLAYSVGSYGRMIRRLATATLVGGSVYESDGIGTAFVFGFLQPRIILPSGVSGDDRSYILEHERTHIRRKDYLVKPLAFLALVIHWFNPLVWLSFMLMSRDMEMSCDESVIRRMGGDARGGYSNSLLSMAVRETAPLTANPLSFGENHVAARVRNVLSYRKPALWVALTGVVLIVVLAVGFVFDPEKFDLKKTRSEAMLFSTEETDLLKIGEAAARHYHSSFMGSGVPREYRITRYAPRRVSLLAGDAQEFCVQVISDYSTTGLYFLSANGGFVPVDSGYYCEGDYQEFRIKRLTDNKYRIVSIGTGGGAQGLIPADTDDSGSGAIPVPVSAAVEASLSIIMSSPQTSSNPQDYIDAHQGECEKIMKLGDDALWYMMHRFEDGFTDGLRGQIMMRLCKRLLGARNNVLDDSLSPQEWHAALSIRPETKLPDFAYDGNDPIEKLVYSTETKRNSQPARGFTVVAPHIFGSYAEGDWLKIFVTTWNVTYRLYDNVLEEEGGGVVPAAITYKSDGAGNYVLSQYQQAEDGTSFAPSIRAFCTLPVSGKEIPGLADRILDRYGVRDDIRVLVYENLRQHLRANGVTDATLTNAYGKVVFSLREP